MNIYEAITALSDYAVRTGLIEDADRVYSVNSLLEALQLDSYEPCEVCGKPQLAEILDSILDYACKNGICEDSIVYRDLFDTKIMGLLTPRPSWVIDKFESLYAESPKAATDFYYDFSKKTNYIRADRLAKDVKWITPTPYGDIDMTINLSKPEKDPRAIAAALKMKQSSYPKCQLCRENEGYAGRVNHPARQNHRIIPITMGGEPWFLQYSPYGYYNEHCIAFNGKHTPMTINKAAFEKLFDFVKRFPHYFIGSNADLPIVGGSILTHEHFQGGCYTFAMTKAEIEFPLNLRAMMILKQVFCIGPCLCFASEGKTRHAFASLRIRFLPLGNATRMRKHLFMPKQRALRTMQSRRLPDLQTENTKLILCSEIISQLPNFRMDIIIRTRNITTSSVKISA